MIVYDSLPAHIIPHVAKLRFLDQLELLFLNHKAVVHVADELHQLPVGVHQRVRNLVQHNLLGLWHGNNLHRIISRWIHIHHSTLWPTYWILWHHLRVVLHFCLFQLKL